MEKYEHYKTFLGGRLPAEGPKETKAEQLCQTRWVHYVTTSQCHYVTTSLCHYVTMSLCHYVTMSLCHSVTVSTKILLSPTFLSQSSPLLNILFAWSIEPW